ncbi:class I SAM-dependent methyltransferase [Fictibacillus gelatini]|uniref:class I SAM-dependent methyltransferase n=1 Tax=Fictibacillus gelatini TaxID=225985 RepID=UPI000415B61D|nr:class I SAM-dependent methyltransferase [Fictibacillus gelatini]
MEMDIKKSVQQQFGDNAEKYVTSRGHAKGADLLKMVEIAEVEKNMSLLDIATGGGHVANAFAPYVKEVVALDLTPEILAAAERFIRSNGHTNVTFIEGDAESLPFPDESFHVVTCRIAAHHFPNVQSFIKETHRVLKPNGIFLLIDNVAPEKESFDRFYNDVEKKRDRSHFRAWKKSEWIQFLETAGFHIESLFTFKKTFPFDSWCERMKLPNAEKEQLRNDLIQSTESVKRCLNIIQQNDNIVSFQGEAILIKTKK